MSFSIFKTATIIFQQVPRNVNSRRLLLHTPLYQQQAAATPPLSGNTYGASEPYSGDNRFDGNVVMVISILLCALICLLGLNSIVRCALRRFQSSEPSESSLAKLSNTGVNKEALKTFPIVNYSTDFKLPGMDAECVICLSEFAPGERVKVLPKCNHGFHVRCIDRWLTSHSSCPTCRHCLIQTCQKIVGSSVPANTSQQTLLHQQTINVIVAPLEAEGMVRSYQT
ncbi:RING-type E3 ubiquitin transferase [Heracleum sosnowskyi]|uniref:RING-type E3 ubiquitin transferase n=1 Tax=Heracleum sosnowskyi TaxID=360622 RepID=A0AAD8NDL0_9APIA|nr:RING-type E3 ubiquitin transferase [Heracleum sosnowskyi]KAK1403893.1 RING-type E3 ubiquitin transferase [Heracleum sosnowskyi]